ncbi:MAG: phosphodiester glycosidase family protein [Fimbriimonadaceae bacterium]|nr:phosphodiester glycosidase family protein [Fimbriimonadaceae bacterium]
MLAAARPALLALLAGWLLGGCGERQRLVTTLLDPDVSQIDYSRGAERAVLVVVAARAQRRVRIVSAGRPFLGTAPLPELAPGATAAVNGGYFDVASGAPLGALRLAGEWIAMPLYGRTALVLPSHGPPRIEALAWRGEVRSGGQRRAIEWFNRTPPAGCRCAVTSRRFPRQRFSGLVATPAGGGLTVHTPDPLPGTPQVLLQTAPAVEGDLLGAGPRLLRGGRVEVTKELERFRPDVADSVTARSALGLTAAGSVVLAMGAGSAAGGGFSLERWAALLLEHGVVDALALDSHTMSALVTAAGRPLLPPLTGRLQAVATAVVVDPP